MKRKPNLRRIVAAMALITLLSMASHAHAQIRIQGVLKCETEAEAHAFGTIALLSARDTSLVSGTISDADGRFLITVPSDKNHEPLFLRITYVGYEAMDIQLGPGGETAYQLGFICLNRVLHEMEEFVFVGERISAAGGETKTTYFLNKKMYDASFTGGDVLRFIPGVQVDLMQNISMEGSQAVAIMVNGRERDAAFVRQLDAGQIDKIEVIHHPGSRYEAGVSGVINIILKEPEIGLRAFVNAEIPTASSEVYIFPNYGIQYTKGKFTLSTSYTGEVTRMNRMDSNLRNFRTASGTTSLRSTMDLRQDHWSHRFNVGLDFMMNEKTQFNIYGFINPYSRENSGTVAMQTAVDAMEEGIWAADKQDTDKNLLSFGSVYFEHRLQPGSVFTLDAGYYHLRAENTTAYIPISPIVGFLASDSEPVRSTNPLHLAGSAAASADAEVKGLLFDGHTNTLKPTQHTMYAKADFSAPISGNLNLEAGARGNLRKMQDFSSDGFSYKEQVVAAYAAINFSKGKGSARAGLRSEYAVNEWEGNQSKSTVLLPYLSAGFKPATNQNLQLTFRQSLRRPTIYELSPTPTMDDPWSVGAGNPLLEAEKRSLLTANHSIMAGNTFIASQLFYHHFANAINPASFINENGQFETQVHNLGDITQYGLQLSGSLNFHPAIAINPYVRVFQVDARPNSLAGEIGIAAVKKVSYETGLSVIVKLHERLTASFASQYVSPITNLQQITFSNMLYFVSLEKSFRNNWRVGVTSALPLQRSFTYHGTSINGPDLYSRAEGNIVLSAVPVWIKLSYQFNSGKRVPANKREIENFEAKPKIGF
jgi:hypothetical protein